MNNIEKGPWPSKKAIEQLARAMHAFYRETNPKLIKPWRRLKHTIEEGLVKE